MCVVVCVDAWVGCHPLQDKDRFQERYQAFLAKRLLLKKSQSEDMEKSALAQMKLQNGPQYTERAERMITDLAVSLEQEQVKCNCVFACSCPRLCTPLVSPFTIEAPSAAQVYKALLKAEGALPNVEEFSASVLTSSCWRALTRLSYVTLPPVMQECAQHFKNYFSRAYDKVGGAPAAGTCSCDDPSNVFGCPVSSCTAVFFVSRFLAVCTPLCRKR